MTRRKSTFAGTLLSAGMLVALACGDDEVTPPPLELRFGETTFVVLVNPAVNDANAEPLPQPGTTRSGVTVSVDGGPSVTTDANGVAVLAPVAAGIRTISLSGGGLSGTVSVSIANRDAGMAPVPRPTHCPS